MQAMCVTVESRGNREERGSNGSVLSVEKATVLSSSTRHRFTCQQRGDKKDSRLSLQSDERSVFFLSVRNERLATQRLKQ